MATHFGIKRNRQALAGNYIKSLDCRMAVVCLQKDQSHQLVGFRSKGEESQGDLKMLTRPRQLLLRISKRNGKATDSAPCFVFLLLVHTRALCAQGAALLGPV